LRLLPVLIELQGLQLFFALFEKAFGEGKQ